VVVLWSLEERWWWFVALAVVCNHTTTLIAFNFGFSRTDFSSNNDHNPEDKGKPALPIVPPLILTIHRKSKMRW
jgi:hypothetical protein